MVGAILHRNLLVLHHCIVLIQTLVELSTTVDFDIFGFFNQNLNKYKIKVINKLKMTRPKVFLL